MIRDEIITQQRFAFDISYISEQGGRPVNEDSVMVEHTEESILLSIADGLGAHGGGDVASKVASDVAKKEFMKISKPNSKNINRIFQTINDAIVDEHTDDVKMKTTLSCVLCRHKWIYAVHLGDTRIYIFNNKGAYVTADHSVAYDEVMKNHGTLDDIRKNPNRHILNAALGADTVRTPDVFKQKIRNNLSVLICSDGFWEYVNEDEMFEALANTTNAHDWLEAMLQCHSEKAGIFNDNYSAVCLKVKKI